MKREYRWIKNYLHMSVPTVSIITPSYNQIEYLRDSLDYIQRQTYDDIEHFVLDGGVDGRLTSYHQRPCRPGGSRCLSLETGRWAVSGNQ
jgi:cellulose synthase/poly-beta-1,6-N-acetylglucosamine synthase-like glycosyltransferase